MILPFPLLLLPRCPGHKAPRGNEITSLRECLHPQEALLSEQHHGGGIEAVRARLVDNAVVDIVPRRGDRAKDGGAGARPPSAALEGLGPADVPADRVEEVVAAGAAAGVAGAGDEDAREYRGDVLEADEAVLCAVRRGKRRRSGAASLLSLAWLLGRVRDAGASSPLCFATSPGFPSW